MHKLYVMETISSYILLLHDNKMYIRTKSTKVYVNNLSWNCVIQLVCGVCVTRGGDGARVIVRAVYV